MFDINQAMTQMSIQPTPFNNFPPELRNMVYNLVAEDVVLHLALDGPTKVKCTTNNTSLSEVCQYLRFEYGSVLHHKALQTSTIHLHIIDFADPTPLFDFINQLVRPKHGQTPTYHFKLQVINIDQAVNNLITFIRAADEHHDTIKATTQPSEEDIYIWHVQLPPDANIVPLHWELISRHFRNRVPQESSDVERAWNKLMVALQEAEGIESDEDTDMFDADDSFEKIIRVRLG